jgi:hypothetical protein
MAAGRPGLAARLISRTGCSAAWRARVLWVHEAAGSNPASPTDEFHNPWPGVGACRLVHGFVHEIRRQQTGRQPRDQVSNRMAGVGILQDRVAMRVAVLPQSPGQRPGRVGRRPHPIGSRAHQQDRPGHQLDRYESRRVLGLRASVGHVRQRLASQQPRRPAWRPTPRHDVPRNGRNHRVNAAARADSRQHRRLATPGHPKRDERHPRRDRLPQNPQGGEEILAAASASRWLAFSSAIRRITARPRSTCRAAACRTRC